MNQLSTQEFLTTLLPCWLQFIAIMILNQSNPDSGYIL